MARLSKSHERARSELLAAAQRTFTPEALGVELMSALQRAIGWDGFRLFGVDSRSLLINRLLAASDNDGWARREWLKEVYLDADALPYIHIPAILRSGLKGIAYQERQEISWGYPEAMLEPVSAAEHHRYFHESRSPTGGVLMAGFAADGQWIAALQAYRRDPGASFRPGDVEFLRQSGRLVGTALGRSLIRERIEGASASGDADLPGASGVAVVDQSGGLVFATPAGQAWIDEIGAAERLERGLLPTALWSAMLGLRQSGDTAGSHVVQTLADGQPVLIEASPGPDAGAVAIVISQRQAPSAEIPEHWPLTNQQKVIAMRIASGLTNRQIADALFISENTVEWHVRQIFSRLDVRSRTELTARYFQESVLGRYRDPDLAAGE